jgi:hypothetical protein
MLFPASFRRLAVAGGEYIGNIDGLAFTADICGSM